MIELQAIGKNFGETQAVKQVSFTVKDQENLVLLGTSGCGKTTTLKMINRLIEADRGNIKIDGQDIQQVKPETLRRGIGYVMQNIGLFPHYTIAENIAVVPKLLRWRADQTLKRTQELLAKLHLPESCLNQFPNALSGGQQQRVGLARALVTDPPILLMDEPFGALDNVTRTSIQAEFKALEELKRKTIVMVTHDVQEAFELADRICLMDKGEVVQIGTPKELLYTPVNEFAKNFLDGQRLALEFKLARLKDLLPYLSRLPLKSGENFIEEDLSVWAAMEYLRTSASDQIHIRTNDQGILALDFESLSRAFNQYEKAGRYE